MSFPVVSPSISNSESKPIIKNAFIYNHWRWAIVSKNMLIALFIIREDATDFMSDCGLTKYGYSVVKVNEDGTYQEPA